MATATHTGEEIEVTFSCRMVTADYGVSGSPEWDEPTDIEIDEVVICGVAVDHENFPKEALAKILRLADDLEFE